MAKATKREMELKPTKTPIRDDKSNVRTNGISVEKSKIHYREFVQSINRSGDREIELALKTA